MHFVNKYKYLVWHVSLREKMLVTDYDSDSEFSQVTTNHTKDLISD